MGRHFSNVVRLRLASSFGSLEHVLWLSDFGEINLVERGIRRDDSVGLVLWLFVPATIHVPDKGVWTPVKFPVPI